MKRVLSIIIIGALFSIANLSAQGKNGKRSQKDREGQREKMEEMNSLAKAELNLNEGQTIKWDEITESFSNDILKIRSDESLSKDDRRMQMHEMRRTKDAELKAILGEEQLVIYEELKSDMRKQYQKGNSNHSEASGSRGKSYQGLQFKEELGLSDEQSERWDEIYGEFREKNQEISNNESLDDEGKKNKRVVLREEMSVEIIAILDSEQQASFISELDQRQERKNQNRYGKK